MVVRDVGFLRYWKLSNLPLFLLAAPMLYILLESGAAVLAGVKYPAAAAAATTAGSSKAAVDHKTVGAARTVTVIRAAAAAQVLLAVMAITNYHVQIITRIASGCPVWYFWLGQSLIARDKLGQGSRNRVIVTFMVMYAAIQGVLFTSFLPPA